jgi:hypothetical protein
MLGLSFMARSSADPAHGTQMALHFFERKPGLGK